MTREAEGFARKPHMVRFACAEVVSDRGPQFASRFWERLNELLGSKVLLSSAFHPQTDGQTERTNQTLEQYLRCFTHSQQDDWADLLPAAEFAFNNTPSASTLQSPFFALTGAHPRMELDMPTIAQVPAAEERIATLKQLRQSLGVQLKAAQDAYKLAADRDRRPHPDYAVGDRVWLDRRNIKTKRLSLIIKLRRNSPDVLSGACLSAR